jgi:hypothetical protein
MNRPSDNRFGQNDFDKLNGTSKLPALDGVVAQLVEHHNGIVGVRGSNPLGSTILEIKELRKAVGKVITASNKQATHAQGSSPMFTDVFCQRG